MIPVMYSRDDVIRRLHGTAAIYNKEVLYICAKDVFQEGAIPLQIDEVYLYPFSFRSEENIAYNSKKVKKVKYTDNSITIKGLRGGYTNVNEEYSSWIIRDPTRDFHLGLHPNNVRTLNLAGGSITRVFYSKAFSKTLLNEYPSFEEANESIRKYMSVKSKAFGQEYCLNKIDVNIIKLEVRGIGVALSIGKQEKFIPINNKVFSVIEEELFEAGVKLN